MPGRVVEVPPADVDRWCRAHLGAGVAEELFRCGYLSTVIGVRLASGEPVVVKVRPRADRLVACSAVHRAVYGRGFPCPQPLVDLQGLGPWLASAESLVSGGELLREEAWAAGLWTRSFDAKKQLATEGSTRILSEGEARERLRRAGAG